MRLKKLIAGLISGACLMTCSTFPLTVNADKAIGDEYPLNGLNPEDSPVKPTLSLSRIELSLNVAKDNPIQDIELKVSNAAGKWGATGIHIDLDERLSLVEQETQYGTKYGFLGDAFPKNKAGNYSTDAYEISKNGSNGLFITTVTLDMEKNKDGVFCSFKLKVPDDIKVGDEFPISIRYKGADNFTNATDQFSNIKDDDNGKLMQAWTFTNGIEHGYIKIIEPEDPYYPVTKETGNLVYTINGITPFDENVKMLVNGCVDNTSKEMIVPDKIEEMEINYLSFKNCENVEKLQVPEYLTSFHMKGLVETAWYKNSPDGILYLGDTAVIYKGDKSVSTSLKVKEGTTKIADNAFEAYAPYRVFGESLGFEMPLNDYLTDITLPDSLEYIGKSSFCDCDALEHIELPNSLKKIDRAAFSTCDVLDNVVIPESVEYVGTEAFFGCASLKSITFLNPNCEIEDEGGYGLTISNKGLGEGEIAYKGTIYGYNGSTAQAYAEKYGYNFKAIDDEPETTTTTTITTTSTTTTAKPTTTTTTTSTTTTAKPTTTTTTSTTTTAKSTTTTTTSTTTTAKPTTTTTTSTTTTAKPTTTTTTSTTTTAKPTTTTTSTTSTSSTTSTTAVPVTTTVPEETVYDLGDVNGDDKINAVDASVVLTYYAMMSTNKNGDFNEGQKTAGDVNHDGSVNAVDASCILSYYAYTSTTKDEIWKTLEEFLKKQ